MKFQIGPHFCLTVVSDVFSLKLNILLSREYKMYTKMTSLSWVIQQFQNVAGNKELNKNQDGYWKNTWSFLKQFFQNTYMLVNIVFPLT